MAKFDIVEVTKTILRSVATEIPGCAVWVNAWNEHEALETKRRLELFMQAFICDAQQNAQQFAQAGEQRESLRQRVQVLERAVEAARHEPNGDKVKTFARFAANAMAAGDDVPQDDKLTLLEALDTLTQTDLATLAKFANGRTLGVDGILGARVGGQNHDELGRLVASLHKLEARGLVSETNFKGAVNVSESYGSRDHWTNVWMNKKFEILPLGTTLFGLLNARCGKEV